MWLPNYEHVQKGEVNVSEIIKELFNYVQVLQIPTRKDEKCCIKYLLMVYSILSVNSSRNVRSRGNF